MKLRQLIKTIYERKKSNLLGVCFGHQVIAHSLVNRSPYPVAPDVDLTKHNRVAYRGGPLDGRFLGRFVSFIATG